MYLVVSVRLENHYESIDFVCVSVISFADAVGRLLSSVMTLQKLGCAIMEMNS